MTAKAKLNTFHTSDPEFRASSRFLKECLKKYFKKKENNSLDIPCGNGRNIFLLNNYFNKVTGIDLENQYLNAITEGSKTYNNPSIVLKQQDILNEEIEDLNSYDFVCNIQFFDLSLLLQIVSQMKIGALLFVETPDCRGENFRELPTEEEIRTIFYGNEILKYNFRPCTHAENTRQTGAAQILIKKK